MTTNEQLTKVKASMNITGDQMDANLTVLLKDVKGYLKSAGVKPDVINDEKAIGCIAKGVSDLFNYGELSNYFYQRVSQLVLGGED